jgi:Mg-chelatase subunit ChlD
VLGPAALAVAALWIDIAVETALSGSPLRWWVVGSVVVAAAVLGLVWKRTHWDTRFGLLTVGLFGLVAGAAWAPEGLVHGLAALRQPTATVLAGASALGLLVAGVAALRWRFLHPGVRALVALLAAYGMSGFVLAILRSTSFTGLFHGESFFERVPFFLQGAVLGALGVLPLVALIELARAAFQVRGRAFRPWTLQLATLAAGIAIGVAGLLGQRLDARLTTAITERGEPEDTVDAIGEDQVEIHVALRSALGAEVKIEARWIAEETLELEADSAVAESSLALASGQRSALTLRAPEGGFSPGRYRVELSVDGEPREPLHFAVTALLPPLQLLEEADVVRGFNLAREVLGGRVARASSEYDENWGAARLIDGGVLRTPISSKLQRDSSPGWSSKAEDPPFELVFGFHEDREALIRSVILDPTTSETESKPQNTPKHLEVWVSPTGRDEDFAKVSEGRMGRVTAEQVIAFEPIRARRVKLRILSNHGGDYTHLGEVKILEDASHGRSILDDVERNLALPWLGGAVVRMSSQYEHAAYLIDGVETEGGWRSYDDYLPQELVFAFAHDREAFVESVSLVPYEGVGPEYWPRTFTLAVSSQNPLDGFVEIGSFELAPRPEVQVYPVGRPARFVKLRILENGGGNRTMLREVKILEGPIAQRDSILYEPRREEADWRRRSGGGDALSGPDADLESERNDDPGSANSLSFGRFMRGTIDPLGESDYYALDIPRESPVLTLDLLGHPYIRTSLALLDPTGTVRKRFDPGARPGDDRTFSWRVDPGPHRLHVTEPPVSMVLIWDTSGSMSGRYEDLGRAVEAYIDQVQPSERLHLIDFDSSVQLLTSDFTSDRAALRAAAQGHFDADGGTAFYDAIGKGIELLEGVTGNKAIVVMTDGEDSASRLSYPEFWKLLEEKRIRLFTIGLGEALENYPQALGNTPRRMLSHIALATNGRSFFARTSEELSGTYQKIADELRTLSTYHVRPRSSTGSGSLAVVATGERIAKVSTPLFELILDASGSMREQRHKVGGRLKIDVAKEVAMKIVEGLPDDATVAFRVYGRRIREGRRGDCQDSELVFPFGRVDKPRLVERIREIQALGTTPLAYSLQQAASDFGDAIGEKVLILVTDGKEECGGSPAQVVEELKAQGFDIRVNVVGFALAEELVKQEMQRVAELTGGRFFDAQDAAGLRDAIEESLAVPYDVFDAEGERVAGGLTGRRSAEVPEGIYTVAVRTAGDPVTIEDVPIREGEPTRVEIKKEGEEVGVRVVPPPETVSPQPETEPEVSSSGTGRRTGDPEKGSTSVNEEESSGTGKATSPRAG